MTEVPEEVAARLATVTPARRRRDAETVVGLMQRVTGQPPVLVGSMIGFGHYEYRYDSGRSGEGPAACFAPRRAATVVYLSDGTGAHAADLARLGPHSTGVGCLYLPDVDAVDLDVLERIVTRSYATLTAGTFTSRAREVGEG